jgi:hypothetical protein
MIAVTSSTARADDAAAPRDVIDWGLGAKVRRSHVSEAIQELFVEDSPGAAPQDGAGIELTRRQRQLEVVFGIGYDRLDGRDGFYLEKGGDPLTPGDVDEVVFDHLEWFTAELTIVGHAMAHRILGIRYGGGIGLGYMRGEVRRTDAICTGGDLDRDCVRDPAGMQVDDPVDLLPVMPVVNVLVGLELRPSRFVAVYADLGLHTVPYVAVGLTLYPWRQ